MTSSFAGECPEATGHIVRGRSLSGGQIGSKGRHLCEGSLQITEPFWVFDLETVSSIQGLSIGVCHSEEAGTCCVGRGTCFRC